MTCWTKRERTAVSSGPQGSSDTLLSADPPHHRVNAIVILSPNATRDASTFNRGRGSVIGQEYLAPGFPGTSLLFVLIIFYFVLFR